MVRQETASRRSKVQWRGVNIGPTAHDRGQTRQLGQILNGDLTTPAPLEGELAAVYGRVSGTLNLDGDATGRHRYRDRCGVELVRYLGRPGRTPTALTES